MPRLAWLSNVGLTVLLVSCGGEGRSGAGSAGPATRDSAGITIVANGGPEWADGAGWTIAEAPTVDIGSGSTPETDLSQVASAIRTSDGRIAVATTLANVIRFYDSTGTLLTSVGRKGSGPGEYQGLSAVWNGPGDSLIASDPMLQRLTMLDAAGAFGRSFSLGGQSGLTAGPGPGGRFGFAIPINAFPDGSVLGMMMDFSVGTQREGTYRDTVALIRYGADGQVADTMGRFPGVEMTSMVLTFGNRSVPAPTAVPLGRQTVSAATSSGMLVAQNNAWELEERDRAGRIRRLIRIDAPAARLTEADIAAHREEQIEVMNAVPQFRAVPQQMKDQFLERVRTAPYPDVMPWIAALFPVSDGTIWVEEVVKPGSDRRRYAVIDSTGAFLGRITAPADLRITSVYPDVVIGVWRDQDDLEHVRVHPIIRP